MAIERLMTAASAGGETSRLGDVSSIAIVSGLFEAMSFDMPLGRGALRVRRATFVLAATMNTAIDGGFAIGGDRRAFLAGLAQIDDLAHCPAYFFRNASIETTLAASPPVSGGFGDSTLFGRDAAGFGGAGSGAFEGLAGSVRSRVGAALGMTLAGLARMDC